MVQEPRLVPHVVHERRQGSPDAVKRSSFKAGIRSEQAQSSNTPESSNTPGSSDKPESNKPENIKVRTPINSGRPTTPKTEETTVKERQCVPPTMPPAPTYQGTKGRPSDSLENILVDTPREFRPTDKGIGRSTEAAAKQIQDVWRFWTMPRLRAGRYDPRRLAPRRDYPPGTARLPGYELSTREASALHHLVIQGRIGELDRSLAQLHERGTRLTERSLLPMCILARHLGDPHSPRAIIEFAERQDVPRTGRLYDEAIITVLEQASMRAAEAIAWQATKGGFLLSRAVRSRLEKAGSYSTPQWRVLWRL